MPWCYGNASTRKRTQKWVWVRLLLFSRIIWNPSKTKKCWGISEYFGSVSAIYIHLICFPFFCSVSSFFWVSFQFSEKFLNFQFVDLFPLYLGPFPLILGPFPIFSKSFKFSVCWSVSSFLGPFPHFLGPFPVSTLTTPTTVCFMRDPTPTLEAEFKWKLP